MVTDELGYLSLSFLCRLNGKHYGQTCEDWLKLQDKANRGGKAIQGLREDARAKGQDEDEAVKTFYR